jgi:hypothetical protein
MNFEGKENQPPYMREREGPRTESEREARAQLEFLYQHEAAMLEQYQQHNVPPDSEEYRVVLERLNALGNALNGVPGMYEHIDVTLSPIDRIKRMKKDILDIRAQHRTKLIALEKSLRPNADEIHALKASLDVMEKRLQALDELLTEEVEAEQEEARHRLPNRRASATGNATTGPVGLGHFEGALPSRDKSALEKDR